MIRRLFENERPIMVAGVVAFVLFLATVLLAAIDTTEVLGISRWIKPAKFFISIAVFLWTMAIYFDRLRAPGAGLRRVSWAMIAIFIVEMAVIVGQAVRGQRSHFNISTAFDGALFAVMGIAIAALTLLVAYVAVIYFRSDPGLPSAVLWGLRLGLVIMLLGSIQGGYMSSQAGHAVAVADGGPGLPFVNWSTAGGDLRVAHFVGLHALQAVPLFAYLVERLRPGISPAPVFAFSAIYTLALLFVFVQALAGRPLIAI